MSAPAETIRRVATLMRERAQAATPGPWRCDEDDWVWRLQGVGMRVPAHADGLIPEQADGLIPEQVVNAQILKAPKQGTSYAEYWPDAADAAQITSWHPLVALAVADWLDLTAGQVDAELYEAITDAECCGTPGACSGHPGILTCNRCAEPFEGYCNCWERPLALARAYLGEVAA